MPDESSGTWQAHSHFLDTRSRNAAVLSLLAELFEQEAQLIGPPQLVMADEAQAVLNALVSPLQNEPPRASQAAEAALTLAAFSLAEGRVLNLRATQSRDLNESGRVAGDRGAGDRLCSNILAPRNIPATQGPLQSSSFRSGYLSRQVRSSSLRRYIEWQSEPGRTIDEVRAMAEHLVSTFLSRAASMPVLPDLIGSRFTFIAYRQARDRLLSTGSGGALEQYLLTGLLNEELAATHTGLRATTKNVGANDKASGAAGDIEIRQGHALRGAIEVTAASWDEKVDQLTAVADARLSEAVIAAPDVTGSVSGDDLADIVAPVAARLGLDVAVIDLHALMDVAASRITKAARAEAFRFVYRCIALYHRRQPELAERLITSLIDLGLASTDGVESADHASDGRVDVDIVFVKVRDFLAAEDIAQGPDTPNALRDLASWLETRTDSG